MYISYYLLYSSLFSSLSLLSLKSHSALLINKKHTVRHSLPNYPFSLLSLVLHIMSCSPLIRIRSRSTHLRTIYIHVSSSSPFFFIFFHPLRLFSEEDSTDPLDYNRNTPLHLWSRPHRYHINSVFFILNKYIRNILSTSTS